MEKTKLVLEKASWAALFWKRQIPTCPTKVGYKLKGTEKATSSDAPTKRAGKAKRSLTKTSSDGTMDSQGLPILFKSPDPKTKKRPSSALEKANPAEDLQMVSLQRPGSRLHEAMGYGLGKPMGKAKAKANLVLKKPSAKNHGKGKVASTGLGKDTAGSGRQQRGSINQTNAKKPESSYLQGKYPGGSKHLIVEVTAKQSTHYKAIIGKIRESLEKDWITKAEALEMRAQLLQNMAADQCLEKHWACLVLELAFGKGLAV